MEALLEEYKMYDVVMKYADGLCFRFRVCADKPTGAMLKVLEASEIEVDNCCSVEIEKEEICTTSKSKTIVWENPRSKQWE